MSIDHAAQLALQWWTREDAIVMVAIAGAESSWREDAQGDPASYFHSIGQYQYDAYACGGYLSFGYWQIFLGVHHNWIAGLSGSADPCTQAAWLKVGANNARVAFLLWKGRKDAGLNPFTPWSTYNNGSYNYNMHLATAAVDKALGAPPIPPGEVAGCRSALLALPWLALRGLKYGISRGVKRSGQYDSTSQEKRRNQP